MADLKFEIDGKEYDVPDLTSFDMNEAETLYTYTQFSIEDLIYDEDADDAEEVQRRLRHPGIIKTLLHISYQRANPDVKPAKVAELIGKASYVDAVNVLVASTMEDDAGPPLSSETSEQPKQSDTSSSLNEDSSEQNNASSGNGSGRSSDEPGGQVVSIGTGASGTSSPAPTEATRANFGPLI